MWNSHLLLKYSTSLKVLVLEASSFGFFGTIENVLSELGVIELWIKWTLWIALELVLNLWSIWRDKWFQVRVEVCWNDKGSHLVPVEEILVLRGVSTNTRGSCTLVEVLVTLFRCEGMSSGT